MTTTIAGQTIMTVMISCEQRVEARAITIPQFERFGFEPAVTLSPCAPAGGIHNAATAATALTQPQQRNSGALFLEDDVDAHATFPTYLRTAVKSDAVTYFYTHERADRMYQAYGEQLYVAAKAGNVRPGLYPVHSRKSLFHTQAVYIPSHVLQRLDLDDLRNNQMRHGRGAAFDEWFTRYLHAHPDVAVLVAVPNPVQHRNDRTARAASTGMPAGAKRSKTYDLLE